MTNYPCRGCWWTESGRCYNANLGKGEPPRGHPLFSGKNGFEQSDSHLELCASMGGRQARGPIIDKAIAELEKTGVKVFRTSTEQ